MPNRSCSKIIIYYILILTVAISALCLCATLLIFLHSTIAILMIPGRDVAIGGVGGVTPPPVIQTLVKVDQNGTDICPKLVKMEIISA